MTSIIKVSAVILKNQAGRILTVRKAGTERFMLPGGKPEPGEDAVAAALRECAEELGVELDSSALIPLGVFTAPAANEAGFLVEGHAFYYQLPMEIEALEPAAEIAELRVLELSDTMPSDIAPLLKDCILPAYAKAIRN